MQLCIVIVGAGNTGQELARRLGQRYPVTLVDSRQGHPSLEDITPAEEGHGQPGVRRVSADGSSRLVLEELFDDSGACALVAVAGSDTVNLEVGRLGREIGYNPVIAIQHDGHQAEAYRVEHITALDRTWLLANQVEQSIRHQGAVVPSGIGLGKGELIEIRLLRTSPVLQMSLKDLAPQRWRVAAVFRGDQLIVPTGNTTMQVDDRVLLVGDPEILPSVAEYLHLGLPQFPRPYGPHVATLEFSGQDETIYAEAEYLASTCAVSHLSRGYAGARDEEPAGGCDDPLILPASGTPLCRTTFDLPLLDSPDLRSRLLRQRPGVVVTGALFRRWPARLLGLRGADARLCDQLTVPVLFSRGTFPYQRILLPVSSSRLNMDAAELAIDLTRKMQATLTAVNVDLPGYISGEPPEVAHEEVKPIRRLFELYNVSLDYQHRIGNPIIHLLAESAQRDLVVVARRRQRRDTYFDPDVALRLARAARCSVLVLTTDRG